ncbi:carbohydrate ABC transporter permease [Cellulomonas sp. Marseille-Q8402]
MTTVPSTAQPRRRRRRGPGSARGREAASGWLFLTPMLVILGLFLVVPVLMALWVSLSDWSGRGSPLSSDVSFVGLANYDTLLLGGGLATQDFGTALRNNAYYVLLVVPLQTALALFLATMVNRKALRGKGFFRTAFYFPSVTSSVAITVLWLFLFSASGTINGILARLSITGPNWFNDPDGVLHLVLASLGVDAAPAFLAQHGFLGIPLWQWAAGPSVAMSAFILLAVFTTSGTFMLLFLAALQAVSAEVEEAALVDGANGRQRFFRVTLPMLRPTVFTVVTLGLIGTWQVFDQIYTGTQGGPAKTTMTPAYLSYTAAFQNNEWGRGAAIAFVLFGIIVALTVLQRIVLRDRDTVPRRKRFHRDPPAPPAAVAATASTTGGPGAGTTTSTTSGSDR